MNHRRDGGDAMRLTPRHRHHGRSKAPRIAISQAEITADLHYPAGSPPAAPAGRWCQARRPMSAESGDGLVLAPEGTAADVAEAFAASSPETSRTRTLTWQDPVATAAAGATMTGMEYMTAVVTGAGAAAPDRGDDEPAPGRARGGPGRLRGRTGGGALQPDRRRPRRLRRDPARLRPRLRRPHHAARRRRLHLARPRGQVRAADHAATPAASSARRPCSTAAANRRPPRRP